MIRKIFMPFCAVIIFGTMHLSARIAAKLSNLGSSADISFILELDDNQMIAELNGTFCQTVMHGRDRICKVTLANKHGEAMTDVHVFTHQAGKVLIMVEGPDFHDTCTSVLNLGSTKSIFLRIHESHVSFYHPTKGYVELCSNQDKNPRTPPEPMVDHTSSSELLMHCIFHCEGQMPCPFCPQHRREKE